MARIRGLIQDFTLKFRNGCVVVMSSWRVIGELRPPSRRVSDLRSNFVDIS